MLPNAGAIKIFEKWNKQLKECKLFENIPEADLNMMLNCLNPDIKYYKRNELITMAGENFKSVGIVLSGKTDVVKENAAGNRIIMAILEPGQIFGETMAFSNSAVWLATVSAEEDSAVMFIPPEKIVQNCARQCSSHKLLIVNMLQVLSEKAIMLSRKVDYLAAGSIRRKISLFLLEQYKSSGRDAFVMPMKRNELADFLNVPRPSLSREMCKMRDEGIIKFNRSSVRIMDMDALKESLE